MTNYLTKGCPFGQTQLQQWQHLCRTCCQMAWPDPCWFCWSAAFLGLAFHWSIEPSQLYLTVTYREDGILKKDKNRDDNSRPSYNKVFQRFLGALRSSPWSSVKELLQSLTSWWRDKFGATRDGITLHVVATLELFPVRRWDKGHSDAMTSSVTIGRCPRQDK